MRSSAILLATAAAAVSAQQLNSDDLAAFSDIQGQDLEAYTEALASITADPAYSSLVAAIATADPTSLYNQAASYADGALSELSAQAATASGAEGAYLSGLYTSATAALASYDAIATSYLGSNATGLMGNMTAGPTGGATATGGSTTTTGGSSSGGSGSGSGSGSDSDSGADGSESSGAPEQSGNGAAATAVPMALGAVGMAVLGFL